MPLAEKIIHIFEPTPLQCGQAVIAMLSGLPVSEVAVLCGTERETTLKDMVNTLSSLGITMSTVRKQINERSQLPELAVLSLETPHCWHWSLYVRGIFYDPEYGVLEDFPPSARRYCFEIKQAEK